MVEEGDLAGARSLYERSLEIREKALGPAHHEVAEGQGLLANLLAEMGEHARARSFWVRSLETREKALGPRHPELARSLMGLGALLAEMGEYAGVRALYERALGILEPSLGPSHPWVAACKMNLARLFLETGEIPAALAASLQANEIARDHLRLTVRTLAEREALRYASVRDTGLDVTLSLAAMEPEGIPAAGRQAWDALIRSRALVFDEMAARRRTLAGTDDPGITRLEEELNSARQKLANLLVRGTGGQSLESYRRMLDGARREREEAERALAEKSTAFREEQAGVHLGLTEVATALPEGSALVAYARYSRHEVGPTKEANASAPALSYLAFALRAGEGDPAIFPLGPAREIESLVSRWSEETGEAIRATRNTPEELEAAYRQAGEALRSTIWDPVAARLKGVERVFVVPDGALHVVGFTALPADEGSYLVEKDPIIHYLTAERDIVSFSRARSMGAGLLALGGAAFDESSLFATLSPKPKRPKEEPLEQLAALLPFRGERSACADFRALRFAPLPETRREVRSIASLWKQRGPAGSSRRQVHRLTGAEANEAAFKAEAPGRQVLHLATHGFFLGGRCESALDSTRGIAGPAAAAEYESPPVTGENPLLLSGLALAGANHRESAGPREQDGILTAEEIAALDLSGVEWAVLSACDTGLGTIKAGEGVFGLRRAFQVAGARTLIMSLWSVEDEATREWMKALYEARLEKGLDTAESVREASLSVLRRRREAGESTHPFYWGAFVAAGDWR